MPNFSGGESMTEKAFQDIEAREKAATKGPWYELTNRASCDLEFLEHARTDIPALIAELKRLEAEHQEDETLMRHKDDRIEMDDATIKKRDKEMQRYRELAKGVVFADVPKLRDVAADLLKEVHDGQEG